VRAANPRDRKAAHGLGIRAERVAVGLLRLKGYKILARNYCIQGGEIDIAFVEVKARPILDEAKTAIGAAKRQRISRAARTWLASNPWAAPLTWRGDAVYLAPWRWPHHEIAAIELDLG
jgi:putative endonuclease